MDVGAWWAHLQGEVKASDWIALAVAIGTFALAFATFRLAGYARHTADDNRQAVAAFKQQAAASERHAAIAEKTLNEQRDLSRRQMKAHIVWTDVSDSEIHIQEDPRSWSSGELSGTAIRVQGRVRNLAPVAAYVGDALFDAPIVKVIPRESHVQGGGEAAIDVYVVGSEGVRIDLTKRIGIRYSSMASGDEGIAEGVLQMSGTIVPQRQGIISSERLTFDGYAFVSPADQPPPSRHSGSADVRTGDRR